MNMNKRLLLHMSSHKHSLRQLESLTAVAKRWVMVFVSELPSEQSGDYT